MKKREVETKVISPDWAEFRAGLPVKQEDIIHPHVATERANLFTATAFESIELEYLDLLYGLVRVQKPLRLLETGTYNGHSAAAMGYAARSNQSSGHDPVLHTVESNPDASERARLLIQQCGLHDLIVVHTGDSLKIISEFPQEDRFNFVLFDSSRLTRLTEFDLLVERNLLAQGSLLVFHDTSPLRGNSMREQKSTQDLYILGLRSIESKCVARFDFSLSRGLTIFQFGH